MKINRVILVVIIGYLCNLMYSQSTKPIPLDEALQEGKIKVIIASLGGSTGDVIAVIVQRKEQKRLRLNLKPGTVFKSVSGTVQNMVGMAIKGERVSRNAYRPTIEIELTDDDEHVYIIEAYCLDFHKPNPGMNDSFILQAPDNHIAKILLTGKKKGARIEVIQCALWIDRENITNTELKSRFKVNDADIKAAYALLQYVKKRLCGAF